MRDVSRREALAAGAGLGLAWTGVKYGGAWLRTGSLRCADLVAPIDTERWTMEYSVVDGFDLTVLGSSITLGDEVRFSLRNVTSGSRTTGTKGTYTLQRRTDTGWEHVLLVPKETGWPSSVVGHEPGEGFFWTFEFTRDGLTQGPYHVCGDLTSGEYRFGYTAVGEAIPAARFDVLGDE